jgi:periplasmic divalent cation tolerance protein
MPDSELGIALIAAPGDRAETIARAVVQSRKAACAQVTSEVTSLYWWKDRMEEARERLIILKTEESNLSAIRGLLKELHPYEVPELVFLPITAGNPDYLAWLSEVMFKKI